MKHTWVIRTPLEACACRLQGLKRVPFAQGIFRTNRSQAILESPVLEAPGPFDDLVGSWNAQLPPGARLEMSAQTRAQGQWSAWYSLGTAIGGANHRLEMSSPGKQEDDQGSVAIDTIKLKSPALAARLRIAISAPGRPALLRLAAATVSDASCAARPGPFHAGPWVRELRVPARSQMVEPQDYRRDICSPTSLAAVLQYWKRRQDTIEMAERVRDRSTGDFGNWTFNVAAAAALGLEGLVARLGSLEDLAAEVADGRPVIVSLTFGPGELSGAPIERTRGHLVVVSGFTAKGDVIVMDPAGSSARHARRIYDRGEFHRAWAVNKRGLAYLLAPPLQRRMSVGIPVADLRSSPRLPKRRRLHARGLLSQLLYDESVTALSARGDWVRVLADEQADFCRGRVWQGYPGWMRADALTCARPSAPNVVVRRKLAPLKKADEVLNLSVGTRLVLGGQKAGRARIRLLDGSLGEIAPNALAEISARKNLRRPLIISTAALFLGTRYHWGGRSGVQTDPSTGVDCSGLVSLAFRVCGIDVPRDAHEQMLRCRPISRRRLAMGDLVFLSAGPRTRRISHVMIYAGGDGLIESRQNPGQALRCTFLERFQVPLRDIESGHLVTDHSSVVPRKRRIFFGTYFL